MTEFLTLPLFSQRRVKSQNSEQRRAKNVRIIADGRPVRVAYNGSVIDEILIPTDNGVYLSDGNALLARDYVYAVNVRNRSVTLRLRNTRGLTQ
ncbi:hypothetical protein FJZ21_00495 [Candidatus Pacearchaeota archaeon]|nr:hypothetical protein [Candidatus Pacearchaeota archaeon]